MRRLPLAVHTAVLVQSMLKASGEAGVIRWNQSDIALAVGASRVSVGKALKQLENAGFILQKYGVIEVCDPKGLAAWIGRGQGDAYAGLRPACVTARRRAPAAARPASRS